MDHAGEFRRPLQSAAAMLTRIKEYLFADAPVRLDAPPQVALFTYDNGAFVVENYRDAPASVTSRWPVRRRRFARSRKKRASCDRRARSC